MLLSSTKTLVLFPLLISLGCATNSEDLVVHPGGPPLAIQGGLLIDGTGRAPIPNAVVVVAEGPIKAAGPPGQVAVPADSVTIDAGGKVILPGLIDMHVHYRDWMDRGFISHGITTVRDVGSKTDFILEARKRCRTEGVNKPRLYTSGAFLDGSPPVFGNVSYALTTPEQARAAAEELVKAGVDCLKTQQRITLPLLEAITEVAKREHVPVTAHLGAEIRIQDAIALGVAGIEHVSGFNATAASRSEMEQLSDLIVARSVYIVATLVMEEKFSNLLDPELAKDPFLKELPAYVIQFWDTQFGRKSWWTERHSNSHRAILRKRKQLIGILVQKGGAGLIIAGSDVPVPYVFPGVSLHRELELLVSAGLAPSQAIMTATKNAADFLGQGSRLGTLEPGKTADFQILSDNPLENISNIQSVEMVFRDGRKIWER